MNLTCFKLSVQEETYFLASNVRFMKLRTANPQLGAVQNLERNALEVREGEAQDSQKVKKIIMTEKEQGFKREQKKEVSTFQVAS